MRMPWSRRDTAARVASAEALSPAHARVMRRVRQTWQQRAAFFARNLGAVRAAIGITADAAARCELRVEQCVDPRYDTWEPAGPRDNPLIDALHAYKGVDEDAAELVRQHVWNYETQGEMLQCIGRHHGKVTFSIRSVLHAQWDGNGVLIRDVSGGTVREGTAVLYPYELVRRLWRPNEDWPGLSTSALEGVLVDCERYWSLARRIRRDAESAMIGNGWWWTPGEAHRSLPREERGPGGDGVPMTNLDRSFVDYAQRALDDDDSVEAVAPFPMRWAHEWGPPQSGTFGRDLDPNGIAYRDEALEAIGRGLDYPQQLFVRGVGSGKYFTDWLLVQGFAKETVAPKLERVCWRDITKTFLQPAARSLRAKGIWDGDPNLYRVGFDISPIVVNPNLSTMGVELYRLGVLGDEKLLDVTGFDPAYAPNRAELGRWLMRTSVLTKHPASGTGLTSVTPGVGDGGAPVMADSAYTAALPVGSQVRPTVLEAAGWLDG